MKEKPNLDYKKIEVYISKNKGKNPVYQRRKRKRTTLFENSRILNQLFLAKMSIPISQELLVRQINPSDRYIRGKKIEKGTFGTVYES